jgi:hypothetical protein
MGPRVARASIAIGHQTYQRDKIMWDLYYLSNVALRNPSRLRFRGDSTADRRRSPRRMRRHRSVGHKEYTSQSWNNERSSGAQALSFAVEHISAFQCLSVTAAPSQVSTMRGKKNGNPSPSGQISIFFPPCRRLAGRTSSIYVGYRAVACSPVAPATTRPPLFIILLHLLRI